MKPTVRAVHGGCTTLACHGIISRGNPVIPTYGWHAHPAASSTRLTGEDDPTVRFSDCIDT